MTINQLINQLTSLLYQLIKFSIHLEFLDIKLLLLRFGRLPGQTEMQKNIYVW